MEMGHFIEIGGERKPGQHQVPIRFRDEDLSACRSIA
jgi:hypothetical protein